MEIDTRQLKYRCLLDTKDYKRVARREGYKYHRVQDGWYKDLFYLYKDNHADILAVAHLDTVGYGKAFFQMKKGQETVIYCEHLDDRLGAYLVMDCLPALGLKYDILLTTGEEHANSTARLFQPGKQYKWVFSFDRAGVDCALYQYYEQAYPYVEDIGIKPAYGSYSDIVELSRLGVLGFNFGAGYYRQHTIHHHMVMSDTLHMVKMFQRFYQLYKDTALPFDPSIADDWYGGYNAYSYSPKYSANAYFYKGTCGYCHQRTKLNEQGFCRACWDSFTDLEDDKEYPFAEICTGCRIQSYVNLHGLCRDCATGQTPDYTPKRSVCTYGTCRACDTWDLVDKDNHLCAGCIDEIRRSSAITTTHPPAPADDYCVTCGILTQINAFGLCEDCDKDYRYTR